MAQANGIDLSTNRDDSSAIPHWAQSTITQAADLGAKLITYQEHSAKVTVINEAVGLINAQNISFEQQMKNFVDFKATNSTVIPENCLMERCGISVKSFRQWLEKCHSKTHRNYGKLCRLQ